MGNSKSKKIQKEPDKFFERERWKEQKREDKRKKVINQANRRAALKVAPITPNVLVPSPSPSPTPPPVPAHVRSYDDEALARMRWQLQNDSDAFLLNNILLSVQFFENFEREARQIQNNPISERDNAINEAMVRENKHVFFADRLQESIHEHVYYQRSKSQTEPLSAPRLFVIYDNVEASEPGDTSDYSAVLDAPFYKLQIEDGKEPGYVRLKKIEVLESTLPKETEIVQQKKNDSDDSLYTDSEKESIDGSDELPYNASKGSDLLQQIKTKLHNLEPDAKRDANIDMDINVTSGRRYSGPIKQTSLQVTQNNISNISKLKNDNIMVLEEDLIVEHNNNNVVPINDNYSMVPRKSILKNTRRASGPVNNKRFSIDLQRACSETNLGDDTETSGYRSNSSSRHTESSETDSDYGYTTLTASATPKKVELSVNSSVTSGVLPEEIWTPIEVKSLNYWSDEDDEEIDDVASKSSLPRNLFERVYYVNSVRFMNNFVDNFIVSLGSGLGLSHDQIYSASTQGASIYCDTPKSGTKMSYEIFPALVATWPNAANQWIIRERKIIQNPRTNFSYQWPTKYMVNKAVGAGCLLIPIGFRPKRGINPDQTLQWKLIYPAAERYLESCLAHSHIRCYLFTLALYKTYIENETAKIGIDASHIKNHLFWQCEDNYAKWPEDRLGESLRLFLRSFYVNFAQSRMPNYFMENCNDFKGIPKPILLKAQRRIADILEAPVMHLLGALDKVKYTKRDFYPAFNSQRLYHILTCKNPLRIINPNIPSTVPNYQSSSDSETETKKSLWDKEKAVDKHYQWKKERQRQIQERRKEQMHAKKQKSSNKQEKEINRSITLPAKMETVRRRLVLDFFVAHFITIARTSERFEAIKQAIIYLEQAHRLCLLLLDEPGADVIANEYLDVIRDKLSDCQRKLINQVGINLPPRRESYLDRSAQKDVRKTRSKPRHNLDVPVGIKSTSAFAFVDVHVENSSDLKRVNDVLPGEESKL